MSTLKRCIEILLPRFVLVNCKSLQNKSRIKKWIKQGEPYPVPHAVKQKMINEYQSKHNISILVESGTYLGDMIWAQQTNFDKIYSIELSKNLHKKAQQRFRRKSHIQIICGDSGKIMPVIIKEINQKALFWLDAHYSGGITARGDKDCPTVEEVKAILSSDLEHVLLIDDAPYFVGERDYPTIAGLTNFILEARPNSHIEVKNSCIIVELKN